MTVKARSVWLILLWPCCLDVCGLNIILMSFIVHSKGQFFGFSFVSFLVMSCCVSH